MGAQNKGHSPGTEVLMENRVFQIPRHIYAVIQAEAAYLDLSTKGFLRRLIRWHQGTAPGRPPGAKNHEFEAAPPRGTSRVKTSLRTANDQLAHLQDLAEETGLPYSSLIVVMFYRWLDMDPLAPRPALENP